MNDRIDSMYNYINATSALNALAECIHGPCKPNQEALKKANFFAVAETIIKMQPLFQEEVLARKAASTYLGYKGFVFSNFMLQKLKYLTTTILISMLEQRHAADPLILSMRRSFTIDVLKQNLAYVYFVFKRENNSFLKTEHMFRGVVSENDDASEEELIIEVGFNIYFLLYRWSEHPEASDVTVIELLALGQTRASDTREVGTLSQLLGFFKFFGKNLKHVYKRVTKKRKPLNQRHKRRKFDKVLKKDRFMHECLLFYK